MSFNIRYDNPHDGPFQWKHRKDKVSRLQKYLQHANQIRSRALYHSIKRILRVFRKHWAIKSM